MKLLRDALTLLASPPAVQLEHLATLGVPQGIDELALEFDDVAAAADSMLKEGELDNQQRNCVKQLNEFLAQFSGQNNARLWTPEALSSAPQWEKVRRLATDCLTHLT